MAGYSGNKARHNFVIS